MITPNGYLFDREAILEYILTQKKEIAKKTKLWEKQCAKEAEEAQKALSESEKLRLRKFAAQVRKKQRNKLHIFITRRETNL